MFFEVVSPILSSVPTYYTPTYSHAHSSQYHKAHTYSCVLCPPHPCTAREGKNGGAQKKNPSRQAASTSPQSFSSTTATILEGATQGRAALSRQSIYFAPSCHFGTSQPRHSTNWARRCSLTCPSLQDRHKPVEALRS